ncbi:MAG: ABC transporter ATP-binding protein [Clostridia bacterium]|nr:ABC transporter ATP-binding protein [Clostridia bacterium]
MLEVKGITKRYGKVLAVNNVSFALEDGTITVLLGPNGAGKSTLMKCMIGFLKNEGACLVDGHPSKTLEAKRLMGYVPELPSLYPNLTAWEHMEFIARAYRMKNWKDWGEELFSRLELSDKKKKYGDELSKGMQQKLNLCLGLLPMPKVILFDEPMIGLDPHAIKELKSLFSYLRDQGCIVLVSTHMIDSVDMLWDRTLILQKGDLRADVTRQQVEESGRTLEELFFQITEGEAPTEG